MDPAYIAFNISEIVDILYIYTGCLKKAFHLLLLLQEVNESFFGDTL